jgi:hypothetical protein
MIEAKAVKNLVLEDTLKPWLPAVCNSALLKRFVNEIQQHRMRRFRGATLAGNTREC